MVDPHRRLHRHLHAPPRHHGRERRPPRHPALVALEFQRPPMGDGRLLPDPGRIPPHRRGGGRHVRSPRRLRRGTGRLLGVVARVRPVHVFAHVEPGPRGPRGRRRCHVRHLAGAHRRRLPGQGAGNRLRHLRRGDRWGRGRRTAHRWCDHQWARLAVDLLRQRARGRRGRLHHPDPGGRNPRSPTNGVSTGSASSRSRPLCSCSSWLWCGATTTAGAAPRSSACSSAPRVLLVVFVVAEWRQADPMLDLNLFRRPAMVGASIVAFTLSASIFAMFLYITLYRPRRPRLRPLRGRASAFSPSPCCRSSSRPSPGS